MYSNYDALGIALKAAAAPGGAAARDRARFEPFLAAAEAFAAEKNMVVGGGAAHLLLARADAEDGKGRPRACRASACSPNKKPPLDGYHYDLYSARARADAQALAQAFYDLAPGGAGHYAVAKAVTPHKEYRVEVDERHLVTVHAFDGGAAFAPTRAPAFFAKVELGCLPPWVLLVRVYAALGDPSRAKDWEALVGEEERLRRALPPSFREARFLDRRPSAVGRPPLSADGAALARELLEGGYAAGEGRALAGAVWDGGGAPPFLSAAGRLQFVVSGPFPREEAAVRAAAEKLGLRVEAAESSPRHPLDPRLRRLTFFLHGGAGRREAVLDLYDAGQHELVPTAGRPAGEEKRPPRVATPFCAMRFLLVDLWLVSALAGQKRLDPRAAARVSAALRGKYARAAAAYLALRAAGRYETLLPGRRGPTWGPTATP